MGRVPAMWICESAFFTQFGEENMADIGIDLGTTNSAVAQLRNIPEIIEVNGRTTTPSAVSWDDGELLVGQSAKDNAMILQAVLSVKRDMGTDKTFKLGERSYTPPEISSLILQEMVKAAEQRLNEPIDNVVITTPAYFNDAQNRATLEAAKLAGLESVQLLAEPVAASLAYGVTGSDEVVLVYDLGGGTFDVAVVDCFDFKMLGIDGNNYLGGDDFDRRLIDFLVYEVRSQTGLNIETNREAIQLARNVCEKAKRELSERESTRISYITVLDGHPVNVSIKIKREEFEKMIVDLVEGTLEKVESAIERAKTAEDRFRSKDDIDAIILVGGSTYIPLVKRTVADYFGKEPVSTVNPDLAVALGAAIKTATMHVKKPSDGKRKLRIQLRELPIVTAQEQLSVSGKTAPGLLVKIHGGATDIACTADEKGRFSADIQLQPDRVNEIVAITVDETGEERKTIAAVRHESKFTGEEVKPEIVDGGIAGRLPWSLGVAITAEDMRLGVIIAQGQEVPCTVTSRNYAVNSITADQPGVCPIEVYEGDIPYAPFNTHLGTVRLQTPPMPAGTREQLEIRFSYTEDRVLTVAASMVNFPDRMVTAEIRCTSPSGENLHIIERCDRMLNQYDAKLSAEEKQEIREMRLELRDRCADFLKDPQITLYVEMKKVGFKLKQKLRCIEANYGVFEVE